jgi:hypothetical protein
MNKPKPPNGTLEDWMRYRAELALWEYLSRVAPLLKENRCG